MDLFRKDRFLTYHEEDTTAKPFEFLGLDLIFSLRLSGGFKSRRTWCENSDIDSFLFSVQG